jgi:AcrR family transcriptional regulator
VTQADTAPEAASGPVRDDSAGHGLANGNNASVPTRERILDVALDLFTDQGFDGTSMREIAERLRITKPSIYYHFTSKEDILLALHMRQHELGKTALARLTGQSITLETWALALDELLNQMTAHRKLFLMSERNQAALEKLHRRNHDDEHDDIQQRLHQALADPSLSLGDRVRMACSLGAVFGGMFLAADAFGDVSGPELGSLVKDAVRDLLGHGDAVRRVER